MDHCLQEVGALEGVDRPVLGVIHVDVATVLREVGVGQGPAGAVKRVAVAVLVLFEADVNVNGAGLLLRELEVGGRLPHLEGLSHLVIYFSLAQSATQV